MFWIIGTSSSVAFVMFRSSLDLRAARSCCLVVSCRDVIVIVTRGWGSAISSVGISEVAEAEAEENAVIGCPLKE